jgi:MFS family permease
MGGCSLLGTIAFLLFPLFARDIRSASALRVLAGVGLAGVYLPGVRVVAATASPARRGLAVSIYVSAYYFGSAVSVGATGALLTDFGWRGAALALAAVSALAVPLALLGTREAPPPGSESARLDPSVLKLEPIRRTVLAYGAHSCELYVSRGWLAAFLAAVLASQGLDTLESAAEAGKWAALIGGLGTVGVWIGGWLSDRWGRARTAVAIATGSALISLGFGWLGPLGWWPLLAIGCLYGLLLAGDSSLYTAIIAEIAPADRLGSAQAAQAFTASLASSLAPLVAGLALDLGAGYGGAFSLVGLVALAGALNFLPLARRAALAGRSSP